MQDCSINMFINIHFYHQSHCLIPLLPAWRVSKAHSRHPLGRGQRRRSGSVHWTAECFFCQRSFTKLVWDIFWGSDVLNGSSDSRKGRPFGIKFIQIKHSPFYHNFQILKFWRYQRTQKPFMITVVSLQIVFDKLRRFIEKFSIVFSGNYPSLRRNNGHKSQQP